MNNIDNLRRERFARIKEGGAAKFIFKNGLAFVLLFGSFVFLFSKPPVSNFLLVLLIILGGVLFGSGLWSFMLWQMRRGR
ncbi:MAG: hypothetical protein OEL55_03210 [Desulfobulbaceae bacterium]|nr:hypothetical protein [Desulfobulbaceae bacterium]